MGAPGLPLFVPEGFFAHVSGALMPGTYEAWTGAFETRPLTGGTTQEIGLFAVEVFDMPHMRVSLGFRASADGTVLSYTGDSGPGEGVSQLAAGADILLAEATYAEGGEWDSHLTARQAGEVALRERCSAPL
jgi:Cft2 family RNA processing exonuclease